MTNVHKLTEHVGIVENYVEGIENPEEWAVFIGGFSGEYNVTDPDATATDPEGGNGRFEIGSSGFAGDAFGENPVGAYSEGGIKTAMMHTILVHKDNVSDEVREELWGEKELVTDGGVRQENEEQHTCDGWVNHPDGGRLVICLDCETEGRRDLCPECGSYDTGRAVADFPQTTCWDCKWSGHESELKVAVL